MTNNPFSPLRVLVVGVGGGGIASLEHLLQEGLYPSNSLAVDADFTRLALSPVLQKLRIGETVTHGLGCGGEISRGALAAEFSQADLRRILSPYTLVLILIGLGGGTGSGAAPVIARIARECGALVVAVATLPFRFEGTRRKSRSEEGLQALASSAHSIIEISGDRLLQMLPPSTTLRSAFERMDGLVASAVDGVAGLMLLPGLISLDYNEMARLLQRGGSTRLLPGAGEGPGRAVQALHAALECPLLERPLSQASGLLLTLFGGEDLLLEEVSQVLQALLQATPPAIPICCDAKIVPGMDGKLRLSAIALF